MATSKIGAVTVIHSDDEEPQPKKLKQERSPLVVISNENSTKKKQLTLVDILSNNKVSKSCSPKQAFNKKDENKEIESKVEAAGKERPPPSTHLKVNRGTKRKSVYSEEEEMDKTPVKQPAIDKTPNSLETETVSPDNATTPKSALGKTSVRKFGDIKVKQMKKKLDESSEKGGVKSYKDSDSQKQDSIKKKISDHGESIKQKENTILDETVEEKEHESKESTSEQKENIEYEENIEQKDVEHEENMEQKDADRKEDTEHEESLEQIEEDENEMDAEPETPKATKINPDKLTPSSTTPKEKKVRTLTPKQKKLAEEREKKRFEREKAKEEKMKAKEAARLAEKAAREQAKELERKQKEETRKKKEAEREAEKQKREEEKQKKEAEKQKKEAERIKKQQEKEEEKRLETEKKQEEEEKKRQKKLKEQEKFKSFFTKKPASVVTAPKAVLSLEKKFRDFIITPNMSVAPLTRVVQDETLNEVLETSLEWEDNSTHIKQIISEMRTKQKIPTAESISVDLEIISISDSKKKLINVKRKLLSFHENYRPAYNGSWRKTSALISPRRPFAQDKSILDYDYDSDDDWEEEVEGEDITCEKEDEKEEEKEEDDDEDDGFFVPHGYLSDDEGDEDCDGISEEAKKKRLEMRRQQFEEEQRNRSGKLITKIVGPTWQGDEPSSESAGLLLSLTAVWFEAESEQKCIDPFEREQPVAVLDSNKDPTKKELPIEGYKDLIQFMHGSPIGLSRAVHTFQELWHSDDSHSRVSKRQLTNLIPTLMKKSIRPGNNDYKMCWYAADEILEQHGLPHLKDLHKNAPVIAPATLQPPSSQTLHNFTKILKGHEAVLCTQQRLQENNILVAQQKQQVKTITPAKPTPVTPKPANNNIVSFLSPKPGQQADDEIEVIEVTTKNSSSSQIVSHTPKRRIPLMPVSIPKPFHNPLGNAAEAKFTPETNNVTTSNLVTAKHRDSTAAATGARTVSSTQQRTIKPRRVPLIPVSVPTSQVTVSSVVSLENGTAKFEPALNMPLTTKSMGNEVIPDRGVSTSVTDTPATNKSITNTAPPSKEPTVIILDDD